MKTYDIEIVMYILEQIVIGRKIFYFSIRTQCDDAKIIIDRKWQKT